MKGRLTTMMGYSHSVSAAATWLILTEVQLIPQPDTPVLIVTTLACAGAGMLPDIDHKNGTIARSLPPISGWISAAVSKLSSGHRKGTHSLLGILTFWVLATGAAQLSYGGITWASILLAAYVGGLALRMFGAPGGWIGAIALGYLCWSTNSLETLPWTIAIGATVHIIGDLLTRQGVNLLWPLQLKPIYASPLWRKSGYMALPILGDTGSRREYFLSGLLTLYIIWYALALWLHIPYPLEVLFFSPPAQQAT